MYNKGESVPVFVLNIKLIEKGNCIDNNNNDLTTYKYNNFCHRVKPCNGHSSDNSRSEPEINS